MNELKSDKHKVLFVDDEESCCEIFKELMSDFYETTTCISPIVAIEILKSKRFDALISDQNMPDMKGTDLFKKVASETPDIAMIAITGLSDTEKIHEAINNGEIFYFIKKPWEQNEMHSIIQSAIKDKRAKQKLDESEKLIRASFEQAAVGFAHLNPDGSFIRINEKFSEILKRSDEFIRSSNLYNFLCHEDRINNGIKISDLIENDESSLTYDANFILPDNDKVICRLTLSVVRDQHKEPLFIVAMLEDITLQKSNENELIISHELLRQIPNAILVTDLQGILTRWNSYAEKIFGYRKEEVIGKHLSYIYHNDKKNQTFKNLLETIDKTGQYVGENHCTKKDGTEIIIETIASKVFDQKGDPMAVISIHQDITNRKKILKELEDYKDNLENMVSKRTKDIKYANDELKKRTEELEKFNKAMVGRELKIISLKEEINELSRQLGYDIPYPPVWDKDPNTELT